MKQIHVEKSDGTISIETIYSVDNFPYRLLGKKRTVSKNGTKYLNCVATFDIETSTIVHGDKKEGFMYIWQFCIDTYVVMARTWLEFVRFYDCLIEQLRIEKNKRLVVWSHNLSFEFQHIRDFFIFDNVFAKEKRKVLRAVTKEGVEFRCSYYLTNMSLEKACENTPGCLYYKQDGEEFNYSKLRTPKTPLTEKELEYCFCDVRGLYEVILHHLEDDTLATIPMTSTGYVRRDCRNAMRKNPDNRKLFLDTAVTKDQYILLEEAKRGGNTSANRLHVGDILEQVKCFDIASSYPYVMMTQYYPVSCFMRITNLSHIQELLDKYCCLFRVAFKNLVVKEDIPIPYISYHKCTEHHRNDICFNGRLMKSEACAMTVTEIDFEIIMNQYDFDEIAVSDFYIAERGQLPEELKEVIRDYFRKKTELKGVDFYLYMKSKNKLNSIFGMCCTNPVHDTILIKDGEWLVEKNDIEEELEKYYKSRNSFLPIQWGVWVTAHARKRLQQAIDLTGMNTLYVDTDSDKTINVDDDILNKLNAEAVELSEKYHAYADRDGKRYYMGIFEQEDTYDQFRTWGAKKYCSVSRGTLEITVAGVHKKKGSKYLVEQGGIKKFKSGFIWNGQEHGGGTESHWNDDGRHTIKIGEEIIETASNVGILESSYTMGVTDEFLENMDFNIDKLIYIV